MIEKLVQRRYKLWIETDQYPSPALWILSCEYRIMGLGANGGWQKDLFLIAANF